MAEDSRMIWRLSLWSVWNDSQDAGKFVCCWFSWNICEHIAYNFNKFEAIVDRWYSIRVNREETSSAWNFFFSFFLSFQNLQYHFNTVGKQNISKIFRMIILFIALFSMIRESERNIERGSTICIRFEMWKTVEYSPVSVSLSYIVELLHRRGARGYLPSETFNIGIFQSPECRLFLIETNATLQVPQMFSWTGKMTVIIRLRESNVLIANENTKERNGVFENFFVECTFRNIWQDWICS